MTKNINSRSARSTVNAIANLSDYELCKALRVSHNTELMDEFMDRFGDYIQKSAVALCHKIPFDLNLDFKSLEGEALSEAYIAADEAIRKFDGVSATLKTYIGFKIKTRFLDLKRKNTIHATREVAPDSFASSEKDSSGNRVCEYDFVDAEVAESKYQTEQFQKDMVKAAELVKKFAGNDRRKQCVTALLEAYEKGVRSPIEYVAIKLDCTKVNVYNLLKQVKHVMPAELRTEIGNIL